ncbi:MAG TPA: hypothetical protein VJM33_11890 [Microthrixaceae bacterium]|nr:hypothetical protein [Microthrixaceae bacterium]
MKPTVEERLTRAGRTLDAATAALAMSDQPLNAAEPEAPTSGVRWLTGVAAAVLTVAVIGAAALALRGPGSDTEPAAGAEAQVSSAVEATRSVSAMAVDIHGAWSFATDGADAIWNYGAPDRWEQMAQSEQPRLDRNPPGGVTIRLYVGDKTWTTEEGHWRAEVPARAVQPDPLTMLDELAAADCAVEEDGQLVAWNSGSDTCPSFDAGNPSDLPVGTWVWVLRVDDDGRLREVRSGETADFGDGVRLEGQSDPLARVGALPGSSARFWYDNIPEVSGEPAE